MSFRTYSNGACTLALVFALSHHAVAEGEPLTPPAKVASPETPGSTVVYSSAGFGSVLGAPHGPAPSVQGTFHVNLPFGHYVALELLFTAGYANVSAAPNDFWGRIGLGLRFEKASQGLSPFGAFRLVHLHYAPAETWWEHPGASIAGSSADGLQHSSGMAAAFGVTWRFPGAGGHVRGMAEIETSWIPIGNAPEWFATGEVGFGYSF
jgi:hypothetical protein